MSYVKAQTLAKKPKTSAALYPEYLPPVQTHLVRSRHVGQAFKIEVMQPLRKTRELVRFPVVYSTDGNFTFEVLKGIAYCLQCSQPDIPRFILVGIGYPGQSPEAGALLRARDMTFPGYPRYNNVAPQMEGVWLPGDGEKDFYGGAEFQSFIAEELVPFIDETYPVQHDERIYFGHSLGGSFGLSTLFSRPSLFNRYIISSPAVIYDGCGADGTRYKQHDFLIQEAHRFITSGRALEGTRMYMSAGTEEEFEPALAGWQITSGFFRLAALLKAAAISGLQLQTEALLGETHMSVWTQAFGRGLQAVFSRSI